MSRKRVAKHVFFSFPLILIFKTRNGVRIHELTYKDPDLHAHICEFMSLQLLSKVQKAIKSCDFVDLKSLLENGSSMSAKKP